MTDINGILAVHKPVGPTSHDVVDLIRELYGTRRVGHTGTLDPRAEGLLFICLGRATKVSRFLLGMDKTYRATVRLGLRTSTGDVEGEILATAEIDKLNREAVVAAIESFGGVQQQRVPSHSAVKVDGRRLYSYAREGAEVPQVTREITIHHIALEEFSLPELTITVHCSGGTYIRALAEDLGDKLGCGGVLYSLVRTKIGPHELDIAVGLAELADLDAAGRAERVRPIEEYLKFPVVLVGAEGIRMVRDGRQLSPRQITRLNGGFGRGDTILFCDSERSALAVATAVCDSADIASHPQGDWFTYERVLVGAK